MEASLLLERSDLFGPIAPTFGTLYLVLDGRTARLCTTLEPNIASGALVPEGKYSLSVNFSPKFRRNLPLLAVPSRSGIRIHAGNTIDDTSGCILVGVHKRSNQLYNSRIALNYVLDIIKAYKITNIEIKLS